MKLRLTLLTFLMPCLLWAQKHQARFDAIDVQHYRFELQLSDETDMIYGTAQVTIKFKKDLEQFDLDLVNIADGKGMKVLDVSQDAESLGFSHQNNLLSISTSAKAGETHSYNIEYEGIPQTGLIIAENKFGDRTFFGDNWPDRGKHWLPMVDHPSDKATVEWMIIAPTQYRVIGSGTLVEITGVGNGTQITHWKNEVPLPTKVMVMGAALFAVEKSGEVEGKEISSWVYPQNEKEGFYDYAPAAQITQWFVDHIAPFPFAKLANVQSKTQFGGMENAGNIFYYENSVTGKRTIEGLLAHEIAHQWFGNSASEANWHHVWLSEGFATYFTILYQEDKYGKEKAAEELKTDRQQIIAFNNRSSVPVVNPAVENYMRLLNANSYQKGSFVLHMLRQEVGDEVFWKAIRSYYDRYKIGNALTKDLKAVFEEVSGKELDYFFDQWIFQAGHPQISLTRTNHKGPAFLLKQHQPGEFKFSIDIQFNYENGTSETKTFEITEKEQVLHSGNDQKLKDYVIDPDTKLLFEVKVADN